MASYLLLVGAPTSASRAWVVVAFVSVGLLLFRRSSGFAALAVAAILLTARHPTMVHDLGFQLSFCATAGIVFFWWRRPKVVDFDPYEYERTTWKRRLRRVGAFVLMSWCATAVTWPLIVGAMGRISTAALVANPLVVPWIGLVVFPTLVVTTVFATVWPAAAKLLLVPQTLLELTIDALGWLATFPGATWCPGIPPSGFVAVTLIAVFWTIGSRMRLSTLAAAATVVGAMVAHLELRTPPAALRLHFIPVGQGDATLVEFPGGERVLFDAGGTRFGRDPGRWVVVPYLWRLGIARLDALVVTHDDVDHSGGVPGVLSEIDVGRVVTEPEPLHIPGVEVARLMAEGSSNDRSIVASIRQMGSTALLTGDVERAAETAWLAAPEQVTVLKVPHHGSLTSSSPAFLDHSDPVVAVVSAGRHNRFGHPHPAVVDRYRDRAIPLFSTARNGLIVVQVDPDGTLTVRTVR
jgi:competence protein ComEC